MTDSVPPSGWAPDGGPDNPRPGAELSAFAAQLRRLHERVDDIGAGHSALAVSVSEGLGPDLVRLGEQLAELDGQLRDVLDVLDRERRAVPVNWPALTAERARAEWVILAGWIEEILVPWYEVTRGQLPDCWALHRPVVVELSWLRSTYMQAYQPRSVATMAAEWHGRWRRVALDNIKAAVPERLCAPGRHQVSEEDARARPSAAGPGPATARPARQELASRRHWNGFYDQAVTADVAWRHGREQAQAASAQSPPGG